MRKDNTGVKILAVKERNIHVLDIVCEKCGVVGRETTCTQCLGNAQEKAREKKFKHYYKCRFHLR